MYSVYTEKDRSSLSRTLIGEFKDYDEAMDWLEKMVRHEKITAKNYNVITETKLPYFYGRELHYCAKTYDRTDAITPTLAWKVFDPIRDTDRFKAILADAEAFEQGK